ncbi:twin-arginine translocation system protein, TatB [Liberibacter crescens BT-1]|uniref:Twin-arginine translocation system protein, TatB n=1 Tax=Liberibacter crescens (strain BT-1) TaxID=1215343 RepID=L0EXK5_LIBCB|nr:Sec-independent protein translocase protein TatB [Liberibacter crescens]AGA65101.1 twin-arginine translocation system protein, TatB [Liberibacter crescens BT-1]
MFYIGWSELLIIIVVLIIFVNPEELPALLRNLGRINAKIRRITLDIQSKFEKALDDTEIKQIHKEIEDVIHTNTKEENSSLSGNRLQDYHDYDHLNINQTSTSEASSKKNVSLSESIHQPESSHRVAQYEKDSSEKDPIRDLNTIQQDDQSNLSSKSKRAKKELLLNKMR